MRFKNRAGFTLIELLIVALIIIVIIGAIYALPTRIDVQRDSFDMRANVQAAGVQVFDMWRHDLLVAEEVEVTADGAAMTLTRRSEQGDSYAVSYELDEGRLVRRSTSPDEPKVTTLCRSAEDLQFIKRNNIWEMRWRAVLHDGKKEWIWPQEGLGAQIQLDESGAEAGK